MRKLATNRAPIWGKHTLILPLQLKRRLRIGRKYFYSYFTSFGTLIFGVMLAEREQRGKVEGEEGTSCEMTAWLRALSKTEAWTRWEQDKKVEAERVNQYMTRSAVVTCVVCLLDGMICWKVKVPLRSDWKSTYHEEVSWWSTGYCQVTSNPVVLLGGHQLMLSLVYLISCCSPNFQLRDWSVQSCPSALVWALISPQSLRLSYSMFIVSKSFK